MNKLQGRELTRASLNAGTCDKNRLGWFYCVLRSSAIENTRTESVFAQLFKWTGLIASEPRSNIHLVISSASWKTVAPSAARFTKKNDGSIISTAIYHALDDARHFDRNIFFLRTWPGVRGDSSEPNPPSPVSRFSPCFQISPTLFD